MRSISIFTILFLTTTVCLQANNIQVTNVSYDEVIGNDIYPLHFDIAWENSWRTSVHESNYDAAWVFAKWRSAEHPEWQHVMIDSYESPTPTGSEIIRPADGVGVFIQRSTDGIGDVTFENVTLNWELQNELEEGEIVEICVFAIEMVYIPEGPFHVGDGLIDSDDIIQGRSFKSGSFSTPFEITSEGPITLGGTSLSNLNSHEAPGLAGIQEDDFNSSSTQVLPETYPNGYSSFYSMKYEMSQGQYAAFLNSIPSDAALERFPDNYDNDGQTIQLVGSPDYYMADAPERAMNYLSWADLAFYADWSGLRPMTELEYEKTCRGPLMPVAGEYAWGNPSVWINSYDLVNEGTSAESILNPSMDLGNGISGLSLIDRPVRCGIFSNGSEAIGRVQSGAGYYGALDLSGNVIEIIIGVGTPEGRVFDKNAHGDGVFSSSVPASWPAINSSNGQTEGLGTGTNGAGFLAIPVESMRVSFRLRATSLVSDRNRTVGGRLVRSNF